MKDYRKKHLLSSRGYGQWDGQLELRRMGRAFKARDLAWEHHRKLHRGENSCSEFERMSRNYSSEMKAGPF